MATRAFTAVRAAADRLLATIAATEQVTAAIREQIATAKAAEAARLNSITQKGPSHA